MSRLRRATLAIGVVYAIALVAIAIWPEPVDARLGTEVELMIHVIHRLGWRSFDYDDLESLSNVLLFVPLGFLTGVLLRLRSWWLGIVIGVACSALIETAQLLFLAARFATLHDVLMNSIGTVIGVAVGVAAHAIQRGLERRRRLRVVPLRA